MRLSFFPGEDIFISYSRRDGSTYAVGLADELTKDRYSFFLDKLGTEPNKDLPESLKQKIRDCKMLVIMGTESAGTSKAVQDEIQVYLDSHTKRLEIVLVAFDDNQWRQACWYSLVEGIAPEIEYNPNALQDGNPSPAVISRIKKQFTYSRRNDKLWRATAIAAITFVILVGGNIMAGIYATQQTEEAVAAKKKADVAKQDLDMQLQRLKEFEDKRIKAAKHLYAARGIVQVGKSPASLAFDGTNIWVSNGADNTVQAIDPDSGVAGAVVPVDRWPGDLVFQDGLLWVANNQGNAVQAIDPATVKIIKTVRFGKKPYALVGDGKRLWVLNQYDETIQSINPETGQASLPVTVGSGGSVPTALAFDGDSIWVTNKNDGNIQEIDPATGHVTRTIEVNVNPDFLVFDGRLLWTADKFFGEIKGIEPRTGSILKSCDVGSQISALSTDNNRHLWVATNDNTVNEIDTQTCEIGKPVKVGNSPVTLLKKDASMWVVNSGDDTVQLINPLAPRLSEPIDVGLEPNQLVFDNTRIWISALGGKTLKTIDPSNPNKQHSVKSLIYPSASAFDGENLWSVERGSPGQNIKIQSIDPVTQEAQRNILDIQGQSMNLVFDGKRLWVDIIRTNGSYLQSIDPKTLKVGEPFSYEDIDVPHSIIFDGARLWIAGENHTILAVSPADGAVVSRIYVDGNRKTIIFDRKHLWIENQIGKADHLQLFGLGEGALIKDFAANQDLSALTVNSADRVPILFPGVNKKIMVFDGEHLWVASQIGKTNHLQVFDPVDGALIKDFAVSQSISALVFDGQKIWMAEYGRNAVRSVDANTFKFSPRIEVGTNPTMLAFDEKRLWIGYDDSKSIQFLRIHD